MVQFGSNPILYKIRYVNRDRYDSASSVSSVIGNAFHTAMESFYTSGSIEDSLKAGMEFLQEYNDGFVNYSKTVATKQDAIERFSFLFNSYITTPKSSDGEVLGCELLIEENVDVEWREQTLSLPVKLKGYIDRLVRDADGRLKIVDYKTCQSFSDPDKIDGAKIIQAVLYYFLVYAAYGEAPYSFVYEEVKMTKNRDGSPQVREYEIVYEDNGLYFDFFLRYYEDVIRAMNGEQVYVPNVYSMFDNEVAIVAYIQRLDVPDEVAKRMKLAQVSTISDLLKVEMQNTKNMNQLAKAAERMFAEAKSIDYSNMENHEKIQTKMMEHGLLVQFQSAVEGASVDLYRFTPSMGLKMARIKNYAEDIEQVLGVSGVRVLAPIPNSTMIGFEVPRSTRTFPSVPAGDTFEVAIGQNVMGEARRFDIREAPHMLISGASGSGKSVFLNSLIHQLSQVKNCDLYLMDPKRVELVQHKAIAKEYCNNIDAIDATLSKLVREMEQRYKKMEERGVRNIDELGRHRYKIVIIDEFGDVSAQNIEPEDGPSTMDKILRLAQMARAAGIHLVIATQRPSVDVITGTIKANFPVKVAFRAAKATDSRVVLDEQGAEKLLGKGDMLFQSDEGLERLQGYVA